MTIFWIVSEGLKEPLLCQRKKGAYLYKINDDINCNSKQNVTVTNIEIEVPNYKETSLVGQWTGLYEVSCTTVYFFWGSHTKEIKTRPLVINQMQIHEVKKGYCPCEENPISYLHHIKETCEYSWPREKEVKKCYCITRATRVHKSTHHSLTSDEEMIDSNTIGSGYASTLTGAVVTWNEEDLKNITNDFAKKYKGKALLQEETNLLIVEDIQETFTLREGVKEGSCKKWVTEEGYKVKTCEFNSRSKRSQDELRVIENEVIAKLNFQNYIINTYLERFQLLCQKHKLLKTSMSGSLWDNPDNYAMELLNDTALTASVSMGYLMVWPCKKINQWDLKNRQEVCTSEIPIWYIIDGINKTGFLNLKNYHIQNQTKSSTCNNFKNQLFLKNSKVYLWNGRDSTDLETKNIASLSYGFLKVIPSPTWKNNWLYKPEDFQDEDNHFVSLRDMEVRDMKYAITEQEKDYNLYMRMPFVGMPSLPSFTRCLEILSMIGGFMYLIKFLREKLRNWVKKEEKNYEEHDPPNLRMPNVRD